MSVNSSVIISTIATIPGYNITKYKGIVFERVVAGVGLVSEFFAGFSDTFGGRSGHMESQMDNLYNTLLDAMTEKAAILGADGIIGFSIDIDEISGKGTSMLIIQGLGTAVCIEPNTAGEAPAILKAQKSTSWQCVKCNKEYPKEIKYCTFCGEIRHYNWICSSCGIKNKENANFCSYCGKARELSEENVPFTHPLPNGIITEDIYTDIDQMKNTNDIYKYLLERFGTTENEDFKRLLSMVAEASAIERLYGNNKQDSIELLHHFFDHGMHVYILDSSLEKDKCPECGVEQRTDRSFCINCGAPFQPENR